ncbi:HD-GYP domain-containing protein (c-di-GMP phosphodiesterase class II) [Anaerobacterium chartisolvens]|uniref:HD-GYP domain-containing protein (C-di-GMP phosphodiesterase class II) n=1 Tax=Anaerobacterium chartisolvens TaxID=1297424 RepID=A0A369AZQ4_9FIRM|nr:HD domain-containing phosphohydrolase [Anaerobacterium chartisolvens]RCX13818.1 HD-GYP domain-containing protein (c-di-GMP phosphodiesterase class II) [Anaerobacterium chartisolvens]
MKKVFVSLSECMPGMQMAESIYNEYGAVIVAENTILDDHIIKKLDNLGHHSFRVMEQPEDIIVSNDAESFNIQYNENVDEIKNILHEISIGNNINTKSINNMSDSIISRINENRDVVGCINQIRSVDEYTYTHGINVSLLCMLIGKWMKLPPDKLKAVVQAGLLHDIGKTKILPDILSKPSELTEEEYEEIKKHTVHGYRLLESNGSFSKDICMAVLMHHEREDGTGYPVGLKADKIHEFAKIIAVADIYDAMTSDRAYREKESPFMLQGKHYRHT